MQWVIVGLTAWITHCTLESLPRSSIFTSLRVHWNVRVVDFFFYRMLASFYQDSKPTKSCLHQSRGKENNFSNKNPPKLAMSTRAGTGQSLVDIKIVTFVSFLRKDVDYFNNSFFISYLIIYILKYLQSIYI